LKHFKFMLPFSRVNIDLIDLDCRVKTCGGNALGISFPRWKQFNVDVAVHVWYFFLIDWVLFMKPGKRRNMLCLSFPFERLECLDLGG
jgi:hypothetical protein